MGEAAEKTRAVFCVHEKDGRTFWTRVGQAVDNADGSITLRLDALPLGGSLQVRDADPSRVVSPPQAPPEERDPTPPGTTGQPMPAQTSARQIARSARSVVRHRELRQSWHSADTVFNADVTPGVSIRIFGQYGGYKDGPRAFDRTFRVGDVVEHGSYNLTYTGPILAIGAKTVTVSQADIGNRANKRMTIVEFCSRNHDLDLAKIAKQNSEWTD